MLTLLEIRRQTDQSIHQTIYGLFPNALKVDDMDPDLLERILDLSARYAAVLEEIQLETNNRRVS